jgi:hypothetical protein
MTLTFADFQAASKAKFFRPTFASRYTVPRNARHKVTDKLRLGDLLEFVAPVGQPDFVKPASEHEFAVIDALRREKGFFECPKAAAAHPDMITALIEAHFDAPAMRIDARLWMV